MVSLEIWKFIVCVVFSIMIGGIAGFKLGRGKNKAPSAAGIVDIEETAEGDRRCTFKLENDIDWIVEQDTIIFEVRRNRVREFT